jgi:hypothetical protein
MLSPADRELITASLDGELSSADKKQVRELLKKSEPARELLSTLKTHARQLKQLPSVPAPIDFSADILGIIRDRNLTPTPLPPERARSRSSAFWNPPVWAFIATAATLLLTITLGSYFFFTQEQAMRQGRPSTVKNDSKSQDSSKESPLEGRKSPAESPIEPGVASKSEPPEQLVQAPKLIDTKNDSFPQDDPALANPLTPFPAELIDIRKVRMSLILPLKELDQAYPRQKLKAELARDEMIRLDLFCKDLPRGLELLQSRLKTQGVELLTDPLVSDRLKRKQPTELMLFTEAFSTDEIAQFLEQLGVEDQKKSPVFDNFVLAPFLKTDLEKLSKILGVPSANLKAETPRPPIDLSKPITDITGNQLLQSFGKSKNLGILLSYSPINPSPGNSKEIKSFLDRRDRKTGSKPLILVLRVVG